MIAIALGNGGIADDSSARDDLRRALIDYLPGQRWFAAKDRAIADVLLVWCGEVPALGPDLLLAEIEVSLAGDVRQFYLVPLAIAWDAGAPAPGGVVARVSRAGKTGVLYDAALADEFMIALLQGMVDAAELKVADSLLRFHGGKLLQELDVDRDAPVRRLGAEQSNTSCLVDGRVMIKLYRRLAAGIHPEIEIGRFLTDVAGFAHTPPWLGSLERVGPDGQGSAYAAAFGFVANQGDGWGWTLAHLERELATGAGGESYSPTAELLGRRTAEMHRAFALQTDDAAFAQERVTAEDLASWLSEAQAQVAAGYSTLAQASASSACPLAAEIDRALALRPRVVAALTGVALPPEGLAKTRLHGDYHLGQVLVADRDILILDFEGEPARPIADRRAKSTPLKDVAGMLRSFDYAAWASVLQHDKDKATAQRLERALAWRDLAQKTFLDAYRAVIAGCPVWPADSAAAERLLNVFILQKLFYEICYEAANRPDWLVIPLRGLGSLFDHAGA